FKGEVVVNFGKAPLEKIGKVETGVQMSPKMAGEWRWRGDRQLVFAPAGVWREGQKYQVSYGGKKGGFETDPLELSGFDLRLYQDPRAPEVLKIVGTIDYNYPIDRESLKEHTHLIDGKELPLTWTFEELKAHFETPPVSLNGEGRFAYL